MSFVLQTISHGKSDSDVHDAFLKFSKGKFTQKYLLQSKKGKDGWTVKTGPEYVNSLVQAGLEMISGKVKVTGVIVATFNVAEQAGFPTKGLKQFMGIKQVVVDDEIEAKKIIDLMKKQPRAFYALSFSFPNGSLKVKAKAPKSAKPSTSAEKEAVPDFCTLKTSEKKIIDNLLFDLPEGKETSIKHTIDITQIILPNGVKDPVQIREQSIRKGNIVRDAVVDEKQIQKIYPFSA